MKKNLAIFDLDGTLFDTNMVNFLSYQQALKEEGLTLDYDYFCSECNGRHYKEFLPTITKRNDDILERIHSRKKELYEEYLDSSKMNKHLFNIAESMKESYYIAVVTTASKKNCFKILDFYGKSNLFDLVLTHEDIKKTKPDPDGFLKAIEFFNVDPENTVIFEDSEVGIEAARRSGSSVFVVNKF